MRKISEADVEQYLVDRIKHLGGEIRKVVWVGRQKAPDRVVMVPSTDHPPVIFVELKAPDADMNTPHVRAQLREHKRMRKAGATVLVIDSFEGVDRMWPFKFKPSWRNL